MNQASEALQKIRSICRGWAPGTAGDQIYQRTEGVMMELDVAMRRLEKLEGAMRYIAAPTYGTELHDTDAQMAKIYWGHIRAFQYRAGQLIGKTSLRGIQGALEWIQNMIGDGRVEGSTEPALLALVADALKGLEAFQSRLWKMEGALMRIAEPVRENHDLPDDQLAELYWNILVNRQSIARSALRKGES